MSIAAKCYCGKSIYCIGGEDCPEVAKMKHLFGNRIEGQTFVTPLPDVQQGKEDVIDIPLSYILDTLVRIKNDEPKGKEQMQDIIDKIGTFNARLSTTPSSPPVEAAKEIERVRQIAYIAWKGAANAFRMYPENKHTFVVYWDGAKDQFSEFFTRK